MRTSTRVKEYLSCLILTILISRLRIRIALKLSMLRLKKRCHQLLTGLSSKITSVKTTRQARKNLPAQLGYVKLWTSQGVKKYR